MTKKLGFNYLIAKMLGIIAAAVLLTAAFCISAFAADGSAAELQSLIDNAQDGSTITIDKNYSIDENVTIPAGKSISIKDNGSAQTVTFAAGKCIVVQGSLDISASDDAKLLLQGTSAEAESASVLKVENGGVANLNNGTIRGGTIGTLGGTPIQAGAIYVGLDSTLNIKGGIIEDTTIAVNRAAPVYLTDNATLNMTGGEIRNNRSIVPMGDSNYPNNFLSTGILSFNYRKNGTASISISGGTISGNVDGSRGAGLHLVGPNDAEMSGGSITGNKAKTRGGGVFVGPQSSFKLSGGEISYNTAEYGAGIHVWGDSGNGNAKFEMSGGRINNNECTAAAGFGGGIYIFRYADDTLISGGIIENNKAGIMGIGGGISMGTTGTLVMVIKNAAVYNNRAYNDGGGIWYCPYGEGVLSATEGVASFDNKAWCGDDIGIKKGKVELGSRVLGGGEAKYYKDGTYYSSNPSNDGRYDENNPGEPVTELEPYGYYALKTIMSEDAKKLAIDLASRKGVIIRNNEAGQGGGIGTNNILYTGVSEEEDKDVWKVRVRKVWSPEISPEDINPVEVQLMVGDYGLDIVELNEENNWEMEITELPEPASLNPFTLYMRELNVDEEMFEVEYDTIDYNEETHTITIEVINKYIEFEPPEEPPEEEVLTEEEEPPVEEGETEELIEEVGETEELKNEDEPKEEKDNQALIPIKEEEEQPEVVPVEEKPEVKKAQKKSPDTADKNMYQMMLWICTMTIGMLILAAIVMKRKNQDG